MNQPKLICSPYSFNKKLFEAYDAIFSLVDTEDWVCFMDGDTAFLEMSDFGHRFQDYIKKYPNTGMFTCYATRCHYSMQTRRGVDGDTHTIVYLAKETVQVKKLHPKVKPIKQRIAGHLIMMQKKTWLAIGEELKNRAKKKNILGFDTQLSEVLLDNGYNIQLMRGILLFHYLRKLTGKNKTIQ